MNFSIITKKQILLRESEYLSFPKLILQVILGALKLTPEFHK